MFLSIRNNSSCLVLFFIILFLCLLYFYIFFNYLLNFKLLKNYKL